MSESRLGYRPPRSRKGTVLPMLALCLMGIFGFVALAVDLGMLAVSRTQCQNGADVAALFGCRTLNNKPGIANSNLGDAVPNARAAVLANPHLSTNFQDSQIQKIEVGQYLYDPATEQFKVSTWVDVTSGGGSNPPTGSWTAMRVTLAVSQPTYFMKVFGVNAMPTGAVAVAVYRPRDVSFCLDMTGSMAFASQFNYNGNSLNPDNLVPSAGHYTTYQANLIAAANQANGSGEAISRNNYTITTPGGPPIVRNFYYDPANVANPTNSAFPLTVSGSTPSLKNAFHCISASNETPGNSSSYQPPTYNFGSYNAFDTTRTNGPTPAPGTFGSMTGTNYVGDRWRRGNGKIDKTTTSWATGSATTRAAYHWADLLGYSSAPTGFTADWSNFRDPVWETYGYDLDVDKYRTQRGASGPLNPTTYLSNNSNVVANILVPTADWYIGYSMGPGYWGKTPYIWPPDPRYDATADPTNPDPARPAFEKTTGKPICDWRRRFFIRVSGSNLTRTRTTTNGTTFSAWSANTTNATTGAIDPEADNYAPNSGANSADGINEALFRNGSGMTMAAMTVGSQTLTRTSTTTNTTTGAVSTATDSVTGQTVEAYRVNYAAVLKWLKTGPQTLPPNLRAGRVLYYSSIPDDVNTATGTAQQKLDKVFWKNYIDFVFGVGSFAGSSGYLYGYGDSWTANTRTLMTNDLVSYKFAWETTGMKPFMRYTDSPNRPRLHFWFGPLSMMDFMGAVANWLPGNCYEAQCWQLKAGMNSVIDDVRNNHPNDYLGMVMFSGAHNGIRVPMGQNYDALKNALFYPKSLLTAINGGDVQTEIRPFTTNAAYTTFSGVANDEIPNSVGGTDPNTGLAYSYNLLSPSSLMPAVYTTTVNGQTVRGRRGAAKMVILETDGVPNRYRGISSTTQTMNTTNKGYDSFYAASTWAGDVNNGDQICMDEAYKVVQQIVKPAATKGNPHGSTDDSGLSLPNAPAKVYAIGFGDLFDTTLAPSATFRPTARAFLAKVAEYGGTGAKDATTLPDHQLITGDYDTRIARLKDCMSRIFQGGIAVTLIE